jgi:hypothetical protein
MIPWRWLSGWRRSRGVLGGAVNRPVQLANGGVYLRGLIEDGARKSLEPMVAGMGGEADYERVPEGREASPDVKRQYSGTLGKIGNCQIGVSVHAVGANGTVPLGWALYLPEEWCDDPERRRRAKIPPDQVQDQVGVGEGADRAGWWAGYPRAPVLGDEAYGRNTQLRQELDDAHFQYVLSIDKIAGVFAPDTVFTLPARAGKTGRARTRLRPDRKPEPVQKLIARLAPENLQTFTFRDGPEGKPVTSRFCFLRVRALKHWETGPTRSP